MRIPLIRGRDFSGADTFDTRGAAIVSRRFADQFWPGEDPIGQGIRRGANRILLDGRRGRGRRERWRVCAGAGADRVSLLHAEQRRHHTGVTGRADAERSCGDDRCCARGGAARRSGAADRSRDDARAIPGGLPRPAAISQHALARAGRFGCRACRCRNLRRHRARRGRTDARARRSSRSGRHVQEAWPRS